MDQKGQIYTGPEGNRAVWCSTHRGIGDKPFRVMMPEVPGAMEDVTWRSVEGGLGLEFSWNAPPEVKNSPLPVKRSFQGPLDYWGQIRAGEGEIEYSFSARNTGQNPWPDGGELNICLAPGAETGFVDPELESLFVCQDRRWIPARTFCPSGPQMGAVRTRLSPFMTQGYPRLERISARTSADGKWVLGNANDHGSFLAWNPIPKMSCLHCAPVFGPLEPQEAVTTRGKFYLFGGGLEELF